MKKNLIKEVKHFQKIAGILKESTESIKEYDEQGGDDDDIEHYETAQDFLNVVFDIVNDEMRAGYFSEKGLEKVDKYLDKHGEALFRSGKSAEDVAEALMAKFTTARP